MDVTLTCETSTGTECNAIVPPAVQDQTTCTETICYRGTIVNTGQVCMEIIVADLTLFNGDVVEVVSTEPPTRVCPVDDTNPTNSVSFEECGEIEICSGGTFDSSIFVEATPPNGDMCEDQAEYTFSSTLYITLPSDTEFVHCTLINMLTPFCCSVLSLYSPCPSYSCTAGGRNSSTNNSSTNV